MSDATPQPAECDTVELDGFRFSMIPEAMIYSDLSGNAIKIFAALLRRGSTPENCYPGHKGLSKLCHMSISTVRRAIDELVAAGWVSIKERFDSDGRQTSNGYWLHDSPCRVPSDAEGGANFEQGGCSPVNNEREPLNESH